MGKSTVGALFALAMVAVVVTVDLLFFRHHFWERLAVNVGIALIAVALYYRFVNSRKA